MSDARPKVSILMPVKNPGSYLLECMDSILNQSFEDWELISVDDHSSDLSYNVLCAYAQKDSRVQVFKNSGQGIIRALRLAFEHATGSFITRMDSDDIMETDKLEKMSNSLTNAGRGYLSVGLVNYFSENGVGEGYRKYAHWLNQLTCNRSNFTDIYKECSIPSPCWMIHRDDLNLCGAFREDIYPEDYDLAFRFKKIGFKIAAVCDIVHQWRDYDTRTSRTDEHYADNRFAALKVAHFLDQDRNPGLNLILWGAGQKGKNIAKHLIKSNISFQWVCNNPKKIGREIYGIIMEDSRLLDSLHMAQVIMAVSSKTDQIDYTSRTGSESCHSYFRFC